MPGKSGRFSRIGLAFALVAVVGYVAFDWRFSDGTSNPIAFAVALVAVALAIGNTVRKKS